MKAKDRKSEAFHVGQRVVATVERVFPFGAFVRLRDGTEAYVRRRELSQDRTLMPEDVISVGQEIQAVVVALPELERKTELSIRQAKPDPWEAFARSFKVRDIVTATVRNSSAQGVWVQIVPGVDGFIPSSELAPWPTPEPGDMLWIGDQVVAMITSVDWSARRVRLSILRQMIHQAQMHRITKHLRADELPSEWLPGSEELDVGPSEADSLQGLGRVLVIDDDDCLRDRLVAWLQCHGCQADGVSRATEGLDQTKRITYGLVIMDPDLAGQDGLELIRTLRRVQPDTPMIVIGIPEWIAEQSQDLEDAAVVDVLTKPLDLDEVADTLARLAQGEIVGPFPIRAPRGAEKTSSTFQQLAKTMRSGAPLEARLQAALEELVRRTRAELGVLFHLNPMSKQVDVVTQEGYLATKWDAMHGLAQSPVKDLIQRGGEVYETHLSSQASRRFEKLLNVVDFESCLGVPVPALGQVEHAIFLFHREPDAFCHYFLRDAHATATLLGVALESHALEERIQAINPFLMSGQLASGFGHEVFNKMSGLELQVRNLRTACSALARATEIPSTKQMAQDTDQLLQTTLDLKQTVEAFQELIRFDVQMHLDVNQVVARSDVLLRSTARRARVHINMDLIADPPPVAGSPIRLQQAFLNVMLNAIQQTAHKRERWPEAESEMRITTGTEARGKRKVVWVRFTDTGPGIHRTLWDKIFALGFSTRSDGSGLGLFIARSLIESMGGQITVEKSAIPTGTTFLVELPATQ